MAVSRMSHAKVEKVTFQDRDNLHRRILWTPAMTAKFNHYGFRMLVDNYNKSDPPREDQCSALGFRYPDEYAMLN